MSGADFDPSPAVVSEGGIDGAVGIESHKKRPAGTRRAGRGHAPEEEAALVPDRHPRRALADPGPGGDPHHALVAEGCIEIALRSQPRHRRDHRSTARGRSAQEVNPAGGIERQRLQVVLPRHELIDRHDESAAVAEITVERPVRQQASDAEVGEIRRGADRACEQHLAVGLHRHGARHGLPLLPVDRRPTVAREHLVRNALRGRRSRQADNGRQEQPEQDL